MNNANYKPEIIFSSYDSPKNPYYHGGGARAIEEVAVLLAKNYKITLLSGSFPGSRKCKIKNITYKHLNTSALGPKLGHLLYHFLLPFYAAKIHSDLWIENFTPPFSSSFLPLFTSTKIIGLAHSLQADVMQERYKFPFSFIEKLGIQQYSYFITVSSALKNKITSINPAAKVELIQNGIDLSLYKKSQKKGNYILFLGRIEMQGKGLQLLLWAFKTILSYKKIKLIIAGGGLENEIQQLKNVIKKLDLQKWVDYRGVVEGENKLDLLQNALFLVHTSLNESFSLSVLEAMASNLPVILFDIPGFSWIPKNLCVKVKPFSEKNFSKACLDLLSDPQKREILGKAARKFSKSFSIKKTVSLYGKFIQKVLTD